MHRSVKWLSGSRTFPRGQGRDDTRVVPIWVVMKFKFTLQIWVIGYSSKSGDQT